MRYDMRMPPPTVPPGSPVERFTRLMFTRIIAGLAATLQEEELSVAQVAALHLLDQDGPARVGDLAATLQRSTSAASRLADSLVQRGLVERQEDPEDRRAKRLTLSQAGRRLVDRASEERVKVILATSKALPSAIQKAVMAAVMSQFRK